MFSKPRVNEGHHPHDYGEQGVLLHVMKKKTKYHPIPSSPMVALSRNVGRKEAMEMLVLGEPVNAARAKEIGLVNAVVHETKLDEKILEMTDKITSKSSLTIAIGKEAFYRQLENGVEDAYVYASEVMVQNMMAEDAEEGMSAFIDKRQPVWRGR